MEYTNRPLDVKDIISLLKQRGLLFHDEQKATTYFQSISFFRLAEYLRPLEADKRTHIFKPHSTFEQAITLYHFDKQFRTVLFDAIQQIEVALRTRMIHYISLKYGAFWFMNETLFSDKSLFEENISHIRQEVLRSKEDFISEYYSSYSSPDLPPVWKTFEVISLGTLSKIYRNFKDIGVKKQIARSFNLPQHLCLENWLKCTVLLRNYVAHHNRLWNRVFPFYPQLNIKLRGVWISTTGVDNTRLYAQVCYVAYLLNYIVPTSDFRQHLIELVVQNPTVDIRAMGFPPHWQSEPLWSI